MGPAGADRRPEESSLILSLEEAVLTDPYSPKPWIRYIALLTDGGPPGAGPPPAAGPALCAFERAVAALPSSYKLWLRYADFARHRLARTAHPCHPARAHARDVALRAARALPHCPVLWENAIGLHVEHGCWTRVRPVVDEASRSLPLTLHPRLWAFVSNLVRRDSPFPLLAAHFLSRSLVLHPNPEGTVDLFRELRKAGMVDQAVNVLASALTVDKFGGDDRRDLWMELVELAVRNPRLCVSVDVPALVRRAIDLSEAEVGELWVALAEVHTRIGHFHESRRVYEEALAKVTVVRDFVLVFDAYAKFLESLLEAAMEDVENVGGESDSSESDIDADAGEGKRPDSEDATGDVNAQDDGSELSLEAILSELEGLADRRPLLLSNVRLRQNPNNVHEWHKRAAIFKRAGDSAGAVGAYTEAVSTVDPWRASHGKPHTLWLAFARLYEAASDISSARKVLNKAVTDPEKFKAPEDLATIWCNFAEMEIRLGSPEAALEVLRRATSPPPGFEKKKASLLRAPRIRDRGKDNMVAQLGAGAGDVRISHEYDTSSPAWLAWKSLSSWSFYLDLQESLGSVEDVLVVHDKMLELEIATVETIVNGAIYLESKRLFEASFRLLDRGTSLFSWPDALVVWVLYLQKFVERYGSKKLERLRGLFEDAIRAAPESKKANTVVPDEHLKLLYLMYAETELRYGLARHALSVLGRAVKSVRKEQRASIYRFYIVRAAELFGATKTRTIYEDAIESLERRDEIIEFSVRYAGLEVRMGEIDRARAVYSHGAHVADPRGGPACRNYWSSWNAFELAHGSEDTFRDMLRTKRLVQMQNAGIHLVTSVAAGAGTVEAAAAAAGSSTNAAVLGDAADENKPGVSDGAMAELERKVLESRAAASGQTGVQNLFTGEHALNSEEIAVDMDDDESENDNSSDAVPEDASGRTGAPEASTVSRVVEGGDGDRGTGVVRGSALEIEERPVPAAVLSLAGVGTSVRSATLAQDGTQQADKRNDKILGARERLKRKRQA